MKNEIHSSVSLFCVYETLLFCSAYTVVKPEIHSLSHVSCEDPEIFVRDGGHENVFSPHCITKRAIRTSLEKQ